MRFDRPRWMLKRLCPVCEQGNCLVLVVCPGCDRLAVTCDEEQTTFFDPKQPLADGGEPKDATCPGCSAYSAEMFEPASADRIRAEGFTSVDYE